MTKKQKIAAWKLDRANLVLLAETLKRAIPEGTVTISNGRVSVGGGAKQYADWEQSARTVKKHKKHHSDHSE